MSYYIPVQFEPRVIASLVVSGFALATFVGCFIASWFCRWPKSSGTGSDTLRLFMLPVALLGYILWTCLTIASLVISQVVDPGPQYQIIGIFQYLGTWTAEILLALIIQMVLFRRPNQQGVKDGVTTGTRYATLGLILVAFALGAAVIGTRAEYVALYIQYTNDYYTVTPNYAYWGIVNQKLFLAYSVILLLVLAILLAFLVSKVWTTTSKGEAVPILIAILAFFIQKLDDSVTAGHFAALENNVSSNINEDLNYSYSNIIVYDIMAMVVVVCLVVVGFWSKKQIRASSNQNYPNYANANYGVGNNFNPQMVQQQQQLPPQQYTQQQLPPQQYTQQQQYPQQQYFQPPNVQPYPQGVPQSHGGNAYQYPQPTPVSGQTSATTPHPNELSSGDQSQQFAKTPGSPQMLHAPTPQPYRA